MLYFIWSHRHREWWQADRSGYSRTLARAGKYSTAEAAQIVLGGLPGSNTAVDAMLLSRFTGNADEVEAELEILRRM